MRQVLIINAKKIHFRWTTSDKIFFNGVLCISFLCSLDSNYTFDSTIFNLFINAANPRINHVKNRICHPISTNLSFGKKLSTKRYMTEASTNPNEYPL